MQRSYGWKRDSFDPADAQKFMHVGAARPVPLSTEFSLINSPHMPPIYDQGQVGSCVGNGCARVDDFERHLQGLPFLNPSRLGIYFGARDMEGTTGEDAGAEIRDGVTVCVKQGVAPETIWPYDESKVTVRPSVQYYAEAVKHEATTVSRVSQADYYIGHCLEILGRPIVFGMDVFKEFESDQVAATGIVPMPRRFQTPIGGHCVVIVARSVSRDMYGLANSWGVDWGLKGFAWIPRAYILSKLASDFWAVLKEAA